MASARRAGPTLPAAAFIHGGWRTLRDPAPRGQAAALLPARARRHVTALPSDRTLVRPNAAVPIGAGLVLAAGPAPRTAARILALPLIPATIAARCPRADAGPAQRTAALAQVVKNAAIPGGLILTSGPAPARR